ncbi:hypothetical protein B9T11_10125 [Wohlfahrtiimonas chitiniclastica]|uniref:hypothetical protein n=1 Tax=Wohlfahrtiimonas chitiniclastica TaxID=400946 RepID=UPI000B99581A|nr:hypothetical protein [Wohlfahrtiimonas chitiniclastica]OYQ77506.1 hypothetical protein B9T11_10125 [Wohlfahrtiimonas chitiniclastica]
MRIREVLCSVLSSHAAISLMYFSYIYRDVSNQSVLQLFFLGSTLLILFLFIRTNNSLIIKIAIIAKIIILISFDFIFLFKYFDIFISGFISSTSIIYALGEVTKSKNKAKASARLLIYINLITLVLLSSIGYIDNVFLIKIIYLLSLILILFYIYLEGNLPWKNPNCNDIFKTLKKIPINSIIVYMSSIFTINTFYLVVGEIDFNISLFGSMTVFYIQSMFILGVFLNFLFIKKINIPPGSSNFIGLILISLIFINFKHVFEIISTYTLAISLLIGFLTSFVISNTISGFSNLSTNNEKIILVVYLTIGQLCFSLMMQYSSMFLGITMTDWDVVVYITLLPIIIQRLAPKKYNKGEI